jgi:hypothetical protein
MFVGLLVFLSHLFVALFERTKVPDVLYLGRILAVRFSTRKKDATRRDAELMAVIVLSIVMTTR